MATQIQGMQGTQPPMSSVPALAEAVRPVGTSVAVPGSTTGETMVQPVNKSLRVKYRCGGCAAPGNVWGKPRSGERRVGEKGRSPGAPDHLKKKKKNKRLVGS